MHRRRFHAVAGAFSAGWLWPAFTAGASRFMENACDAADAPPAFKLTQPLPYQVLQRYGFDPRRAQENEPGGPLRGAARVAVRGQYVLPRGARLEARTVTVGLGPESAGAWKPLEWKQAGEQFLSELIVPAGGWYRLECRVVKDDGVAVATGRVEPFGVGELFLIAGQSYAAGANDELLKVEDPGKRVAALDLSSSSWRVADDPQPAVGDGGTIWPACGDFLVSVLQVPVGFINVAAGGTSSRQWLPNERLYERLREAGSKVGAFRYLLWQQGESDVIEGVDTSQYVRNLTAIRDGLEQAWGNCPPWLLAKSTLHPTVYKKPREEAAIRQAIDELSRQPGFRPGPDTDLLGGENRGGPQTRRHFTGVGQRRAALLWFAAVWNELQRESL